MNFDPLLLSIKELVELGYAVCFFSPDDLNGVNPNDIQSEMASAGQQEIEYQLSERE